MLRSAIRRARRTARNAGGASPARRSSPALDALVRVVEGTGTAARAATVFGEPVVSGATTVVPVARVSALSTMGGGSSRIPGADGAGGSGFARVRPAGFIVLDGVGARFHPIRQPAARLVLPLAVITAAAATRIVGVSLREARRRRRCANPRGVAATAVVEASNTPSGREEPSRQDPAGADGASTERP
ncbi:GerW family sporulation protein [Nocardiopsis sp. EMB25]|uniref:GerW family sporulation protein n=1 Tax=Nocardiopsis sp. EMB25 TaxID=2835867 RepID=UPI002E15C163